ncbi:MAG: hypothetical protein QW429_06690 [Thermoprotei archaeon]
MVHGTFNMELWGSVFVEPFLFKKYDEVIGEAHDVDSLKRELLRLKAENPQAAEYHLREGHIADWLVYIGEERLARMLRGVSNIDVALSTIERWEQSGGGGQMSAHTHGKMRRRRMREHRPQ